MHQSSMRFDKTRKKTDIILVMVIHGPWHQSFMAIHEVSTWDVRQVVGRKAQHTSRKIFNVEGKILVDLLVGGYLEKKLEERSNFFETR